MACVSAQQRLSQLVHANLCYSAVAVNNTLLSTLVGPSKLNVHSDFIFIPQQARSQYYRMNIKSFPDYKHLLQENYMEYKHMQL
jgi:hypothetical protein